MLSIFEVTFTFHVGFYFSMDIDTIMAKKRKSDAARRDRNTELASVKLTAYQEKEKAKMQVCGFHFNHCSMLYSRSLF